MAERNSVFATNYDFLIRIFTSLCRKPLIFQTMNSDRSSNLSLKYHRFSSSGCKDIRIGKFEFVTKTHFLCHFCLIISRKDIVRK